MCKEVTVAGSGWGGVRAGASEVVWEGAAARAFWMRARAELVMGAEVARSMKRTWLWS